jgi:hypothetical protein
MRWAYSPRAMKHPDCKRPSVIPIDVISAMAIERGCMNDAMQ